jgi:hypothetical protein
MKNVIAWIKSNVLTVVSVFLMLGSIGVIAWSMMHGGAAADKASTELNKMASRLRSYSTTTVPFPPADVDAPPEDITGVTINTATLDRLDDVYGKMNSEYEKVFDPIVWRNQKGHVLLVQGVLPKTDANHLRHETRTAYRRAFEVMIDAYDDARPDAPRLNAVGPLNPGELEFELRRVEEGFRPTGYGNMGGGGGALSESDRKNLEGQKAERALEMLIDRARSAHVYAQTNMLSPGFPFQVGQWSMATGLPTYTQIWDSHMDLWIQQDIVRAIGVANQINKPDRSVIEAPVKRLISITVIPGNVGMSTMGGMDVASEDKSGAAGGGAGMGGYGGGGGMGGYGGYGGMPGAGGGAGAEAPVVAEGSPDQALPVDFHTGPSGRISNAIYDVRHARVLMVVDYQQLSALFNAISSVNFMTVLDCQVQDVDEYQALREGYVYGQGDAVRVDMLIETIWLRDWTTKYMPSQVKQNLGIADPAADMPDASIDEDFNS